MIQFIIHFLETLSILYCLISYIVCGYATFFTRDEELNRSNFFLRVFFWVMSPLIVLDVIAEKLFGKSLLS